MDQTKFAQQTEDILSCFFEESYLDVDSAQGKSDISEDFFLNLLPVFEITA